MTRVIDIIAVVDQIEIEGRPREVCAAAEATFDEVNRMVTISLDCFLRGEDVDRPEYRESAPWLPRAHTVREFAGLEEACDFSHEVVRKWRRRVRDSIPRPSVTVS